MVRGAHPTPACQYGNIATHFYELESSELAGIAAANGYPTYAISLAYLHKTKMKSSLRLGVSILLAAAVTAAISSASAGTNNCGGMDKALPQQVMGMPLQRTLCDTPTPELAKLLNTHPYRRAEGEYKSKSTGETATIIITDQRQEPRLVSINVAKGVIEQTKQDREGLVRAGALWADKLKEFDAGGRIIGFVQPEEGVLTFRKTDSPPQKGRAEIYGAVFGTTLIQMYFPATDINNAEATLKQITSAMNFSFLK